MENSTVTILTHDGRFHADDVTAVSLLTTHFESIGIQTNVRRSRDVKLFDQCDILVDVGEVYNPSKLRFDHHQKDCDETYTETTSIPLSSVGMVWKHYGEDLVEHYIDNHTDKSLDHNGIKELTDSIYFKIIQEIDASDNGVPMVTGGHRNYWSNLNLPSIISSMNSDDSEQLEAFQNAVSVAGKIINIKFKEIINNYFIHLEDLKIVENIVGGIKEGGKEYIYLEQNIVTIYKCLSKLDPGYRIKYLIIKNNNNYTVKTRSRKGEMFVNIRDIATEKVLRDEIGNDLIFVHKKLFIAKTKTLESAKKVVGLSISYRPSYLSYLPNLGVYSKLALSGLVVVSGAYILSSLQASPESV